MLLAVRNWDGDASCLPNYSHTPTLLYTTHTHTHTRAPLHHFNLGWQIDGKFGPLLEL